MLYKGKKLTISSYIENYMQNPVSDPAARRQAVWNFEPLAHVKRVIAVASGKGGVGKSTVTVNLAHALAAQGMCAGILDADIYGPSIPRLMGISGKPEIQNNQMIPLERYGIKTMSMQYITGDEAAIMRGPMISKTLYQLLRMTCWGTSEKPLDILLVDMPPGTGDIHLSMAQQVPLSGVIIVTTPQEMALIDARKCAKMFRKVNVKLLGVVENMCGDVFGYGGGQKLADELAIALLASIPMDAALCRASDGGQRYDGMAAQQFLQIVKML